MIKVEGKITEKEFTTAQWLHQKPRPVFAVLGILLVIILLGVLWLMFFGSFSHQAGSTRWLLLVFTVYIVMHCMIILPVRWKRIYRQQQSLQRPYSLEITDQGISSQSENVQGTNDWSDYVRWKEGYGVFLLYWSDNLFQVIPVRFFSGEEEIEEFRNILRHKVKG